jgi:hypothetical protein
MIAAFMRVVYNTRACRSAGVDFEAALRDAVAGSQGVWLARPDDLWHSGPISPGRRTLALPLALAVFAVALVVAAPAGASAKRRAACKPPHSRTVVQNRLARVYEVDVSKGTNLYGCRRSTGKRILLDYAFDDGYVTSGDYGNVRLSGLSVAWSSSFTDISCKAACPPGYNGTSYSIGAADLRRRKSWSVPGGKPIGSALVVSRAGGVAWASQRDAASPVEIHASLGAGDDRVLDSGNIDPASLAIEITIISWMHDGVERFARLR